MEEEEEEYQQEEPQGELFFEGLVNRMTIQLDGDPDNIISCELLEINSTQYIRRDYVEKLIKQYMEKTFAKMVQSN